MTEIGAPLDCNVEGLLNRLTEFGSYAIPSSHEQDCIEAVTEIRRLQKLLSAPAAGATPISDEQVEALKRYQKAVAKCFERGGQLFNPDGSPSEWWDDLIMAQRMGSAALKAAKVTG